MLVFKILCLLQCQVEYKINVIRSDVGNSKDASWMFCENHKCNFE